MPLKLIALLAGLIPLFSVHAVYLISAIFEQVSWCVPYLEGCTSISEAGRHNPANYVFRATMIPWAVVLMIYWTLVSKWLIAMGDKKGFVNRAILSLGIIAAVFLILYATALGSEGQIYRLLRRYGVIIFFAFTFLAQLLLLSRLKRHVDLPASIYNLKLTLCLMQFFIGLISLPVRAFYSSGDFNTRIENIVEWNFALMMILYFIVSYFAWRASGFSASFSVAKSQEQTRS